MANVSNLSQAAVQNISAVDLSFLDNVVAGNTIREFIFAGLLFLALVAVMKFVSWLTISILEHIEKRHPTSAKEIVVRVLKALQLPLFIILGLKIVSTTISLPEIALKILNYTTLIVTTYYVVRVINAVIYQVSKKVIEKREKEDFGADKNLMTFFTKSICALVWIAAIMFLLNEWGVNVSKVFTGLGIAGIAVAFALQNVLGDIFASVSIYFDKPFKPGDYIKFNGEEGTIIKTGIKSTRIQLLKGDELIVSNKFLTESKVENVDRMEKRRVDIALEVKYGTPKIKLEKLPQNIEQIVKKFKKDAEFSRCHLKALKDYSIEFQLIYFVKDKDYMLHMDLQQKIILEIIALFEKENIEFAYPTHTVIMETSKQVVPEIVRTK